MLGRERIGIHAEGGEVAGGDEPFVVRRAVARRQLRDVGRCDRCQLGLDARIEHVGECLAPDHVVMRRGGFGDQARGQVSGGKAQHVDVQVRHRLARGGQVHRDFVVLERRIDRDRARLCPTTGKGIHGKRGGESGGYAHESNLCGTAVGVDSRTGVLEAWDVLIPGP